MLVSGRPPPPPPDEASSADDASGPPAEQRPSPPPPRAWDLGAVCECLIDYCLRLGSRDNMSVIIVLVRAAPRRVAPAVCSCQRCGCASAVAARSGLLRRPTCESLGARLLVCAQLDPALKPKPEANGPASSSSSGAAASTGAAETSAGTS
jgi:hypothetical protein